MKTDPIRFEAVTTIERFESLRHEWEDLWIRAGGGYSLAFGHCLCTLMEIVIPARANLYCILGWKGQRLVLAWPFIRYREFLWRAIRPLAPDESVGTDVMVEAGPDCRELVASAWRVLLSTNRADLLTLPHVRAGSELHSQVSSYPSIGRAEQLSTAIVPTRGQVDWDTYRKSLPSRSLKELESYKRRLRKEGNISMFIADFKDFRNIYLIEELFRWKQKWAEKNGKKGNFFSSGYREFLFRLLKDEAGTGKFNLFVLALDGRPIAVNLVAVERDTIHGIQAAFDEAYGKFTPGSLLLEHIVKWAFDSRRDFDFGAGGGKYKTVWAGESCYSSTDFRISTSNWGKLAFVLSDVRRWYRARRFGLVHKGKETQAYRLRSELEP